MLLGALKLTVNVFKPRVIDVIAGAVGTPSVVVVTVADATLAPAAFTAFSLILYVVFNDNPGIVIGLVPSAGLNTINVSPLLMEYS